MKISLIQFPIVPGDRLANFDQVRRRVQQAARAGSDMAVLPELWDLSFYPPDVYDLADEEGRQAQAFLQDLAASCHIQLFCLGIRKAQHSVVFINPFKTNIACL